MLGLCVVLSSLQGRDACVIVTVAALYIMRVLVEEGDLRNNIRVYWEDVMNGQHSKAWKKDTQKLLENMP